DNILRIHEEQNHRKTIKNTLKERGIQISTNKLGKILTGCELCQRKDEKIGKTCNFIEVKKPGEKMGIDICEIGPKDLVITAIDYFSRKIFCKAVQHKTASIVLNFLIEIYSCFPFENLLSDNGREFNNKQVRQWTQLRNVKHDFSVPYYHQSNGRIERANRTIYKDY
ncbi:MAG: DDE-type integrase/transposase/recombinase, partial [Aeromonas sp.]